MVLLGASIVLNAAFVSAAPPTKLKINGKIASQRLKTIGGVTYVPVADVAKALNKQVVPIAGGMELKEATGTFQAGNLSGKIGDIIQTKKYSFQVVSVATTDSYDTKYMKTPQTFKPDSPSDTLYIVNCVLKNTLPKAQGPVLGVSYAGNTAIADYDGQSFPPKRFDSRIENNFSGASMLPGSKSNVAVIFSIPKDTKIKDLVFTVTDYFDTGFKGPDVRITLK